VIWLAAPDSFVCTVELLPRITDAKSNALIPDATSQHLGRVITPFIVLDIRSHITMLALRAAQV
jgi:hypothetical protein